MKSKEEIKLDFFKQFGNESFRGYPLEQCHAIWEFFEKYIQCQKDMADKWIKTSEQLPERLPNVRYSNPKVIVWYGEVAMLRFNHEHECWDDEDGDDYCCDIESVEYWMPLPNKPLNK